MAKDKDRNWFRVYRDLLTEELWTSEPFTTGQAWIDLIGLANFADTEKIYKGKLQKIKRGQIATSIRWLAQRWQWSRDKTARTLKTFEMAKMLTMETTTNGTVLTLENYDKYQGGPATKQATTSAATQATTQATTQAQKKNVIKNDKEGNQELHGAYGNVKLSAGDFSKLSSEYGEQLQDLIETLSEYKEATGRAYKNDAAAIRSFARNRKKLPEKKQSSFSKEY